MTWQIHRLAGCAPTPLAHYLKGLGVLRLVARQRDPNARACWDNDELVLATSLSREQLLEFFLREYEPTPMLTPWNGGSGFYPKDNKTGIEAILGGDAPRFAAYREAIEIAQRLVAGRSESPKDAEKAKLLKACKGQWSAGALEWVNAATVVTQASEIAYPAILGSGGNDGRLDFANNFMQRLAELLPTSKDGEPPPASGAYLEQSLFGVPVRNLGGSAIGQFLPGGAGGVNASSGFRGDARSNPWDFVLMLEGAMLLQVTSVRRLDSTGGMGLPQASAPFAVRSRAEGYASAAPADESARGEQWFPLWSRLAGLREIRSLFAEGRLQSGTRRAGEALQAAQAIARLGVARGVTSFQRYAFAERNGQANLAVPVGRWHVGNVPRREAQLAEEIEDWVARLRRAGAQQSAFERHARRLEGLVLSLCQQTEGNSAMQVERLLEALGSAEAELIRRPRATAEAKLRPLPELSGAWLNLVGKGSAEFRIALAIASQRDTRDRSTLRSNFAPLDRNGFRVNQDALAKDPDVVWTDRDLVADLGAVVLRRLVVGGPSERFPLAPEMPAGLGDVISFLEGQLDEAKISWLTRALLALSKGARRDRDLPTVPGERLPLQNLKVGVPAAYALFRVLYSPLPLDNPPEDSKTGQPLFPSLRPRSHSTPVRHLLAGRLEEAADQAIELLRQGGARPRVRRVLGGPLLARRIVASLAIPIFPADVYRLGALIFKPDLVGRAREDASADLRESQNN